MKNPLLYDIGQHMSEVQRLSKDKISILINATIWVDVDSRVAIDGIGLSKIPILVLIRVFYNDPPAIIINVLDCDSVFQRVFFFGKY
ncbi:MAG: hypothetical protein N2746_07995 [Deltaproteobacteria bacterium]|nr:hypothetical protein [Deltaproteobacteria bacterium]